MVLLLVAIQIVIANLVALGKEAFNKKSDLMRGSLSLHLKKRMVKAFVWSVVLHGSETWTLQKEDTRRLEAFEIWIRRRMMKVPWTEHKTNEEILQMVETEREIMDTVRSRQKRWLGHILRHDSLLRITLEGQIEAKKAYGRQRTMLLDWVLMTLVTSFIMSKVDYCNTVLACLPKHDLDRVQSVVNADARLSADPRKYDHATPLLMDLH